MIERCTGAFPFTGGARKVLVLSLLLVLASTTVAQRPYSAIGWGSNSASRLTLSASTASSGPTLISLASIVPIGNNANVKAILGGSDYTTVIMMDDNVMSFGDNSNGQLGLGEISAAVSSPRYLPGFGGAKGSLRTTGYATYLLPPSGESGSSYSWGLNKNSIASATVAAGTKMLDPTPFLDPTSSSPVEAAILDMSCSSIHCVTLYTNGSLLGVGVTSTNTLLSVITDLLLPCNTSSTTNWCPFSLTNIIDSVDTPRLVSASDSSTVIVTAASNILIAGSLVGTSTLPTLSNTSLLAPVSLPAILHHPSTSTPPVATAPVNTPPTSTPPVSTPPTISTPPTVSTPPVNTPPVGVPASSVLFPSLHNLAGSILSKVSGDVAGAHSATVESRGILSPSAPVAPTTSIISSLISALDDLTNVFRVVSVNNLHSSCQPANNGSITQITSGSSFVLFLCNSTRVFGFGNNSLGQINPLSGASISASSPVEVDFSVLDVNWYSNSSNTIVKIAAGPTSAYALTAGGRVIAWGSNTDDARGTISGAAAGMVDLLNTSYSTLSTVIPVNHTIIDISAHISSPGAFVRTAETPGTTCPPVTEMTWMYCSPTGVYTFGAGAVSSGTVTLPAGVSMVGNMTVNGTAVMSAPYGMSLTGRFDVAGAGTVSFESKSAVTGAVTLREDSELIVSQGQLFVNGSLSLAPSATITLKNMNFSSSEDDGSSNAAIVAEGPVSLEGTITIVIPSSAIDALLNAGVNGQNRDLKFYTTVIYASQGLSLNGSSSSKRDAMDDSPSSSPSSSNVTSSSATINLVTSASTVSSCQKVSSSTSSTPGGLAVVMALDSSECDGKGNVSRRTLAIILGSVFGGVALIVVVVALVIFKVDSIRQRVVPYHKARF